MIDPKVFILINIISNVSVLCQILFFLTLIFSVSIFGLFMCTLKDGEKYKPNEYYKININEFILKNRKKFYLLPIISFVFLSFSTIIPDEQALNKAFYASLITKENYEFAKKEGKDLIDYLSEKINEVNKEKED